MGKSHDLATIADDGIASLDIGAGGLTVGTDQLAVDASGRVTMADQPSFEASVWMGAYGNSTITNLQKILFQENFDTANAFSNGRFTAPVSGRYFFCYNLEVCSTSGSEGRFGSSFRKNGNSIRQAIFTFNSISNRFINLSNSVVLDLAANDYIEVYTESVPANAVIWSGDQYSTSDNGGFSGYLIG